MSLETLLRLPKVEEQSGYKRSRIYALMKEGKFPKPVHLAGGGAVAWRSSEIQQWIGEQTKAPVPKGAIS